MKSINVKRIAAVAAGAAMIGSVMASGLAAVQQTDGVTSLVSSIKANLDTTQVVLGSNGADISDGIQAAKIAAVLASVNYQTASGTNLQVSSKSVTLETSAGATEAITSTSYPVAFTANASGSTGGTGHWASQPISATLTKDMVPGILAQKSIQASINLTGTTTYTTSAYNYEDRIFLNATSANYDEGSSQLYNGHGLYLNAPINSIV